MTTREQLSELIDDFARAIRHAESAIHTAVTPQEFRDRLESVGISRRRLDTAIIEALRK